MDWIYISLFYSTWPLKIVFFFKTCTFPPVELNQTQRSLMVGQNKLILNLKFKIFDFCFQTFFFCMCMLRINTFFVGFWSISLSEGVFHPSASLLGGGDLVR